MNEQFEKAKKTKTLSSVGNRAKILTPIKLTNTTRKTIIIDTETIGDILKGEKAFPYDISLIELFNLAIVHQQCWINKNIFRNEYLMNNAFYKNKIPYYKQSIERDIRFFEDNDQSILNALNDFIVENGITYFMAYNVKFDYNAINNLYNMEQNKHITNHFKKLYLIDIWKVATDIIKMFEELYHDYMLFCYDNSLYSQNKGTGKRGNNVSTSAETMAKFLNNNPHFEECHTGLEDTHCELNILKKVLWYYQRKTNLDYYYKLDTVFNPHDNNCMKGGAWRIENIPQILELREKV